MAEKTNSIVCSICLSDFSDPRLIDCHHCFCLRCLELHVETFTVNNHFLCPLCNRDIAVPVGGVKDFATNFYIKESSCSTGDGQRNQELCDVCKKVICNFQCADCDKLLCFSCKSFHDIFLGGSTHNVTDLTKSAKIPTKPEIPENHSDSKPKDFCSNHHQIEANFYCKDCSVAVCSVCFVKNHNGHQFVDLSDDQTIQEFCKELKTIKQDLINQLSKFKTFSDCLEVKVGEVSETAAKLCSQVDDQIQKIYDELKSLGEKTKIQVNDWRDEETEKLNAVNKKIQIECENVGEIVDNSDDVLENKSLVQLIEILPDIRKKQTKQNKRKLDIPVVKSVKFLEGKINSDMLSQQVGILDGPPLEAGILDGPSLEVGILDRPSLEVGILDKPSLEVGILDRPSLEVGILDRPTLEVGILDRPSLEVGQTFCFTTNFNMRQVKPQATWQAADGDDVIPWTVGVTWCEGRLVVGVILDNITDKTIQRVDANYRHKVINNNNDSQSVSEEYNNKLSPGCVGGCLIAYKTFNNKQSGFLDSNNNFTIQTTITITGVSR